MDTLMQKRIRKILLVCNNYDSFALEEDGRIEVQISREYAELNLTNPPVFKRVETTEDALRALREEGGFDLIITMYNVGNVDVFQFAKDLKAISPETPVVLLTSFSREVYRRLERSDRSAIDDVFCWNNSTDLLIAIIKLLEDRLNAPADMLGSDVQGILLVEDSVRYYSTYLSILYKLVLKQNDVSVRDTLNEVQQYARKRARPKILMATNYEDAVALYETYKDHLLGVISDVGFVLHRNDPPETEKLDAGVDLVRLIRKDNPKMPILMQSSQESMRAVAQSLKVGFAMKRSKTLSHEVGEYIGREFGFGDFVAVDARTGEEIGRAGDIYGVEKLLAVLPDKTLTAMRSKNYLSRWLLARGIFKVGNMIKNTSFPDSEAFRKEALTALRDYRKSQGLGAVARFDAATYNDAIRFARLGDGSLGGKARGLAFLNHILHKYNLYDRWPGVRVLVPRTLVVTTDYFDRFILENGLQYVINADLSDAEILSEFVASTLPEDLTRALRVFLRHVRRPLAVRSSSMLEDSYYQPFAGVYSTYMIPRTENEDQQLRLLSKAIKSVYASVYFAASRGYITATANVISEEKMALVLQEICGSEDSGYWFPTLSGVARSLNFYPLGYEKPEEGIVKLAFGLGKAVVDGDETLRFSPAYPQKALQISTPELTMRDTQKAVYVLALQPERFKTSVDDAVNLERLDVAACENFRSFRRVASTFDLDNQRIVDSVLPRGPRFITFAHILKYNTFPLGEIIRELLEISLREIKCPVEIEFAADLDRPDGSSLFNVLQIRPISAENTEEEIDWSRIGTDGALLTASSALGTGRIEGIRDVVYLRKEHFDTLKTEEMAREVSALNARLQEEGVYYLLIGFGRWGSSIPTLGVPVRWSDISEARTIVECSLENFRVDPSQGTHFFQNLTSFNVGYVNVDPYGRKEDSVDLSQLDRQPALYESEFVRHVRFQDPLEILVDGRAGRALVRVP